MFRIVASRGIATTQSCHVRHKKEHSKIQHTT